MIGLLKRIIFRLRGECPPTEYLIRQGMIVGKNFSRQNGVFLDPGHCWLIEIGDNVTLAPYVAVLCHDASIKHSLDCAKIGKVTIGNNVFIGTRSVILPGVKIGDDSIIGANTTVTKDVPPHSVVAGNPGKIICHTDEYLDRMKNMLEQIGCYGEEYTLRGGVSYEKRLQMRQDLSNKRIGFIK